MGHSFVVWLVLNCLHMGRVGFYTREGTALSLDWSKIGTETFDDVINICCRYFLAFLVYVLYCTGLQNSQSSLLCDNMKP